ncbi:MAG TPA: hypothetical protein VIH45_09090 [Desulfuromonadaceae bacterium]
MKQSAAIFCAAAVLALPVVALSTDDQPAMAPQKKEGKVIAEAVVVEHAVVKAIDLPTRKITLAMDDGTERTLVVDKSVRRLEQVKVGDTVKARYREAVSMRINKTRVNPNVKVEAMVERDEKSAKPAGVAHMQMTAIATIDKIAKDSKMVTLRMPDGTTTDVKVRDPENEAKLKTGEVKVGDQIEITYTQAVAISVEKVAHK